MKQESLIGKILKCNENEQYTIGPPSNGKEDCVSLNTNVPYGTCDNYEIRTIKRHVDASTWKIIDNTYEIY